MEDEICLHFERRNEIGGRVEEGRREIPGRRGEKEKWEGAVAIRKDLQENLGSSNHEAPICNAYQATLHFS